MSRTNIYIDGIMVSPDACRAGDLGYVWGGGRVVPICVCEDRDWGIFLVPSENEPGKSKLLYETVFNGDNPELKQLLLPGDFYQSAEDENDDDYDEDDLEFLPDILDRDDSIPEGDLKWLKDEEDEESYLPSVLRKTKGSLISDERKAEILLKVMDCIDVAKKESNQAAWVTLESPDEAEYVLSSWNGSKSFGSMTVRIPLQSPPKREKVTYYRCYEPEHKEQLPALIPARGEVVPNRLNYYKNGDKKNASLIN